MPPRKTSLLVTKELTETEKRIESLKKEFKSTNEISYSIWFSNCLKKIVVRKDYLSTNKKSEFQYI